VVRWRSYSSLLYRRTFCVSMVRYWYGIIVGGSKGKDRWGIDSLVDKGTGKVIELVGAVDR
jgi:hypothetical protein